MAGRFLDDQDEGIEEEEEPVNVQPAPLPLRIIGKTIKYTFWLMILAVNVILFWRLFSTGIPSGMKALYADSGLRTAYSAWIADTSEDKAGFAIYQKSCLNNFMTVDDPDDETGFPGNYGYFGFPDQAIFPSAGQVQLIFRYNRSTLRHVAEDYNLSDELSTDGEYFDVWLRVESFKNPDKRDTSDVDVKYIQCTVRDSDFKNVYCYRQLTADDLPDFADISAIYAEIYYKDDPGYAVGSCNAPWSYGSVCVYTADGDNTEYKLDSKDEAALLGEDD